MPTPAAIYWTEPITTHLVRPCLTGPLELWYIRWLSPTNFFEGWLFTGDVDHKTGLDGATNYTPGDERDVVPLARPGVDSVTLRAGNLTAQQHQALTTLLDAPVVYRQFPNGRLERLFVQQNAAAARTSSDSRYEFAIDVDLRRRNSITN